MGQQSYACMVIILMYEGLQINVYSVMYEGLQITMYSVMYEGLQITVHSVMYEGLQITVHSVIETVRYILRNGMSFVLTEKVNQDCVEDKIV